MDLLCRTFGAFLTELWGQPVIVDSIPGAGATIGSRVTATSAPDGYTIEFVSSSFAIAPSIYKSLPFDTINDFTPIILLGESPLFLAVHPSIEVSTVSELVALARSKPGVLNYGSSGNGTSLHITDEWFKQVTKTDIRHIPYRGTGPALIDFLAGRVQMMFADAAVLAPVKAGKLKALAVASDHRSFAMPDVPTLAEAGVPGFQNVTWYGVVGPKGIPRSVLMKLNDGLNRALKDKRTVEALSLLAFDPVGGSPEHFGKALKDNVRSYSEIVERGQISIK